jgi:hypothetical protein
MAAMDRVWRKDVPTAVPCLYRGSSTCHFICQNTDLSPIREISLETVEELLLDVLSQFHGAFQGLLSRGEITPLLGKLAYDALSFS